MPPFQEEDLPIISAKLSVARETLELATLLAVRNRDIKAFERNFAQVKVYYTDFDKLIEASERKFQLCGLNLLRLLANNAISEFHTELELLKQEEREDLYISYSIELEQRLMEGNYNKVLRKSKLPPMPEFACFTDILSKKVRDLIAECAENAYERIPLPEAQKLLLIEDNASFQKHIKERGWVVKDNSVVFQKAGSQGTLNGHLIVERTLGYATELERIV